MFSGSMNFGPGGPSWQFAFLIGVLVRLITQEANAQGTLTFNEPGIGGARVYTRNFYEQGMWFRVTAPPTNILYDSMVRVGNLVTGNAPHNGTAHLAFNGYEPFANYVVFSMTNGSSFGLTSVDLADYYYPSFTPQTITFNGFKSGGGTVSASFVTAGDGGNFQAFYFGPEFGSGLTRVEIPSPLWDMDNLTFVPEPGTVILFGSGLLALAAWAARKRRQPHAPT
jgi:hypothetical protein